MRRASRMTSATLRLAAGAATLLALLALVAPCGGCGPAAATSGVTLQFWAMGREGEVVQQLAADFEREHPGVRIVVQQIPWTAAHEKLLTAYVGGVTPDLVQLGNTWVPEFVALHALEPLDARVARSADVRRADYFGGIWETNVVDGRLWSVPWYVDTRLLFYHRGLLAAAGYDAAPTTWDAWLDAMRKIQARQPAGRWAIVLPTDEWAQPVLLGLQAGSTLLKDGGRRGDFSGPAFTRAARFYTQMFKEGLAPRTSNVQISNVYNQCARGEFAMYITGPWNLGEFKSRLAPADYAQWLTAPLPGPDANTPGVSLAGGASLAVLAASRHKDEAFALLEFLSRPQVQRRFYELSGDLPPRQSAWEGPPLGGDERAAAFRVQLQRTRPTPPIPEMERIAQLVAERLDPVIRDRATLEDALTGLDADVDRVLEKRRWLLDRAAQGAR